MVLALAKWNYRSETATRQAKRSRLDPLAGGVVQPVSGGGIWLDGIENAGDAVGVAALVLRLLARR
jgi:hypothetical protein